MTFRPYGATMRTTKTAWDGLGHRVIDHDYMMSTTASVALSLTVEDTQAGEFERMPGLWEDGLEVRYGKLLGTVQAVESGGGVDAPTVGLHVISQGVAELDGGGTDPGYVQTTNVPGWVDATVGNMRTKYHKVIDPNLSDKTVELPDDTGEGADDKATVWDALAETAKRCGAWTWFTDTAFFFGKPSWLVDHGLQDEWTIRWDDWHHHTEGLAGKPRRTLDFSKKLWEGREELTFELVDPEHMVSGDRLARNMRPGDRLKYVGKATPADKLWIITQVELPFLNTDKVKVTAWRPIDPPEIVDENGSSSGGEAGVPTGPIGAGRWDGEQLVNATEIVKEGQRRGLPLIALQLAVLTAMGESTLINVNHGDAAGPDSTGLFQQRDNWGSVSDRRTPSKAAGFFYDALTKTKYEDTYNNGGASIVFGGSYGPGRSKNSASLAVHNVQRNSDPLHYAKMHGGNLWDDAKLVVDACINAGTKGGGGGDGKPPSGPLGQRMKRSIDSMTGRHIDFDGSFGAQCADVGMKYAKDLWGIPMVIGNGVDYWRNSALMPYCQALPASASPRYGDIMSWSGSGGAYANGGYGHIAIYISGNPASGSVMTLSQNPGPARMQPLSTSGLLGWMRPSK